MSTGSSSMDVCEMFGVVGIPMIVVVHPEGKRWKTYKLCHKKLILRCRQKLQWLWSNACHTTTFLSFSVLDYVAWKGRFCAFDYSSFERFMTYMFAQVMNREPHVPDPWDTNITIDAMGKILENLELLSSCRKVMFSVVYVCHSVHLTNDAMWQPPPATSRRKNHTRKDPVSQERPGRKDWDLPPSPSTAPKLHWPQFLRHPPACVLQPHCIKGLRAREGMPLTGKFSSCCKILIQRGSSQLRHSM